MSTVLRRRFPAALVLAASLQFAMQTLWAEVPGPSEHDPSKVIAYQGEAVLTQEELDAAFSKLPAAERPLFIRDGGKVDQLIRALLKRKAIAADAEREGYDRQPLVARRVSLEAEKELAEAWLEQIVQDAPRPDYEALAREDYIANPESYRRPETIDVSQILITTQERTPEEARQLAATLEAELLADPTKFDAMLAEFSDDPAKAENGGRYDDMARGTMVKKFENAAFALQQEGDISEPVKTEYGWHIIRLNGRGGKDIPEFGEIREQAVARVEKRFLQTYRENYLRRILADPIVVPEGAVEIMAKRHFGESLELAPGKNR